MYKKGDCMSRGSYHYWQVYFDTNRLIRASFGEAGFAVPEQHLVVRNQG